MTAPRSALTEQVGGDHYSKCGELPTPCAHSNRFFWPFFGVLGGMVGNRTCVECGERGEAQIIADDGMIYEYR
jgi:hypothetical protein